jgi:hypothetical protein
MKQYFTFGFLLFLCSVAGAEGIYKWTDENGKVHYGEKGDATKNSTQIIVRTPHSLADGEGASGSKAGENSSNVATIEATTLQSCLDMARGMVNKKNITPPEIRAESKRLLDMCPGTAYKCVTYTKRPENNSCTAVPMVPGGSITTNTTYNR